MAQEWFYAEGDQKKGPFSPAQLKQLTASGQVTPTTRVWTSGMSEWKESRTIKGLFATGRPTEHSVSPAEPPPMPVAAVTPTGPVIPDPPALPRPKPSSGGSASKIAGAIVSVLVLLFVCVRAYVRFTGTGNRAQQRAGSTTLDPGLGTLLTFNRGQLFYKPSVTQDEANRLGRYLVETNHFNGEPKSIQVTKSGDKFVYRMVLKKGFDESSTFLTEMQRVFGTQLSQAVFSGAPVEIHLCDSTFNTIKVLPPASDAEPPGMAFLQKWMSIAAKCEAAEKIITSENVSPEERSKAVDDLYQAILGMKAEFDTMAAMLSRIPVNELPPNEQTEFRAFQNALPTIKASLPVACEALERMKTASSKTIFDANWKALENIMAQWEQLGSDDNTGPTPAATATSEATPTPQGSGRYEQVRSGMSRAQVEAILGAGRELETTETDGTTLTTVMYEVDGATVSILYWDGKVKTKGKTALP